MISKELLSEVLKKEIREFAIEKNELRYILKDDINSIPELYFINIYELSHKCKEWALKQGYYLKSYKEMVCCKCEVINIHNRHLVEIFLSNSEYKAVFEACQWILDNKAN